MNRLDLQISKTTAIVVTTANRSQSEEIESLKWLILSLISPSAPSKSSCSRVASKTNSLLKRILIKSTSDIIAVENRESPKSSNFIFGNQDSIRQYQVEESQILELIEIALKNAIPELNKSRLSAVNATE